MLDLLCGGEASPGDDYLRGEAAEGQQDRGGIPHDAAEEAGRLHYTTAARGGRRSIVGKQFHYLKRGPNLFIYR